MKETCHVNSIKYSIVQFNNYKQSLKKDFFYELRKNLLDNIELDNEKLLKLKLEFLNDDNNENKNTIRILGTAQSLKLQSIEQYFIDGTYKCVPRSIK